MFKIKLRNNKIFHCQENISIFEAAKSNNIILEHSCLTGRCRSCIVKVKSGSTQEIKKDIILSKDERDSNFILSCNTKPLSNIELDAEDIGNFTIYQKKILPAKISSITNLRNDVIKLQLRFPPNSNFKFHPGQYINLIKGDITRSYSISGFSENGIEFIIKKYSSGKMSDYLFNNAKIDDLLRIEGPLGTFFLRESNKRNLIFLATGTGIAPIKLILEHIDRNIANHNKHTVWLFYGARFLKDIFWEPNFSNLSLNYVPVLSREKNYFSGDSRYVQDVVLESKINLKDSQVYACGSIKMIKSSKEILVKNKLNENDFFSDAFVETY